MRSFILTFLLIGCGYEVKQKQEIKASGEARLVIDIEVCIQHETPEERLKCMEVLSKLANGVPLAEDEAAALPGIIDTTTP